MKSSQSKIIDYRIKDNQNFTIKNNSFKTTNINILLNRVKIEKKNKSKKKIILFFSITCILSLITTITFSN